MIFRHIAFLSVVSVFLGVATLFVHQAADDTAELFRWGVLLIMGIVGIVMGGVLAYED